MTMHEFAFDAQLTAVIRVVAGSESEARKRMAEVLQGCSPAAPFVDANDRTHKDIRVTEFSIAPDTGPVLFEKDGVETSDA